MKKIFFLIVSLIVVQLSFAQSEVIQEGNNKILKGFVTKEEVSKEADFPWFAQNQKGFTPNEDAVKALSANKESIHFLVFGGTWCDDTKSLLPKFYALTDAAGVPANHITLIGVDRSKKTVHNLTEAFNVTRVPTFIILKNGKEIGRVVEYGKFGMIDKEIGEIVSAASGK